ncbi:hypothetical protein [Streptomyces poriferorum]|uniref:Uncharacterized protein n=1 Tax=Streptomyces poriferorum TaxID=2798799 RepID=A0ABY9J040_9ACTN|nr:MULTISPECIES: hypothetical protein [unclassified Streptomyces]MDP5310452.1 hypothetical protein [Streptomyces sp. Alt4]WLQ60394.1 hypothetical protein P8A19_35445 [Streptomyces sp. Alt2]
MVNDKLWHTDLGELDITKPNLGRRDLPGLWELLLQDTRTPLSRRQLQCGGVCRQLGYVEWMHVYERQGKRIAAHEAKTAERRHASNESPEHKAYKERTVRVATEAGHRAEAEVRTQDGKVRSDVLIYGATAMPTSFEIQRSFETDGSIRRRNKASFDHGILAAWHTDDTQMFERNEVAWTRTDNNLPPRAIRDGAHLQVRGGYRYLDMEKCDERRARPCLTKRTGKCGKWHPVSTPRQISYDDFVRGVAAGDVVQAGVKEFRTTFHFWTTSQELDRYEDAEGLSVRPSGPSPRRAATGASLQDPTCRVRPRIEVRTGPVLDWRDRSHWSATNAPCRYCGAPTHLRDEAGRPADKTCAEAQLDN